MPITTYPIQKKNEDKIPEPVFELAKQVDRIADILYENGHITKEVRNHHKYPSLTTNKKSN